MRSYLPGASVAQWLAKKTPVKRTDPVASPVVEKVHAATAPRPNTEGDPGVGYIAAGEFGRRFELPRSQGCRRDRSRLSHLQGTLVFSNSGREVDLTGR